MNLDGTAAIVTGGASGLGLATAEMLARRRSKVTIFDVNESAGQAAASRLGIRYAHVDVTNDADVASAMDAAQVSNGVARLLVNCAGLAPAVSVLDNASADEQLRSFREAVTVNLIGTFIVCAGFANRLVPHDRLGEERGLIVNTSSVAFDDGQIGQVGYAASKAGVTGCPLAAPWTVRRTMSGTIPVRPPAP